MRPFPFDAQQFRATPADVKGSPAIADGITLSRSHEKFAMYNRVNFSLFQCFPTRLDGF
jgi:hypothetical protein